MSAITTRSTLSGIIHPPSTDSGHFNTCRKLLIDGGLVVERDGKVEPTDAAFEKLGMARKKRPGTRAEVLAMWLAALPSPAKDILREVAGGPGAMTTEEIGCRLSLVPRGGHWNTGVSMLRSNDLIRTSPAGLEIGDAIPRTGDQKIDAFGRANR